MHVTSQHNVTTQGMYLCTFRSMLLTMDNNLDWWDKMLTMYTRWAAWSSSNGWRLSECGRGSMRGGGRRCRVSSHVLLPTFQVQYSHLHMFHVFNCICLKFKKKINAAQLWSKYLVLSFYSKVPIVENSILDKDVWSWFIWITLINIGSFVWVKTRNFEQQE